MLLYIKISTKLQLKLVLFFLLMVFGFSYSFVVFAAKESTSIIMHMIPANPAPNEEVDLTVKSYAEDLDGVLITWYVNGKIISSGVGQKSFKTITPPIGSESTVVANFAFPNVENQVTLVIKPTVMVLLWEAIDSYVPPFYKGKALASPDSFVKVVAMPEIDINGTMVDPKKMVYYWEKNFGNEENSSGYGKNSMTFKNDFLENSDNIGVVVNTTDQKYSSSGRIDIGMTNPTLSFYKKDTNLGILWEKVLEENHKIINDETIVAEPYYISPKDIRKPNLVFSWFIDDFIINRRSYKKNYLPLKVEEGSLGTSQIKLEIESTDKIFQSVEKSINVEF